MPETVSAFSFRLGTVCSLARARALTGYRARRFPCLSAFFIRARSNRYLARILALNTASL